MFKLSTSAAATAAEFCGCVQEFDLMYLSLINIRLWSHSSPWFAATARRNYFSLSLIE